MVVAKYIPTDLWHKAIDALIANDWEVTYAYDGMDAGIDYNCIKLQKEAEEIVFEWTNWDEGEIKSTPDRLKEIEKLIGYTFTRVEVAYSFKPGMPPPRTNPPKLK